jgi:hypothetical protein
MKLELNPSIATTQAGPSGAVIGKVPEEVAQPGDGIRISVASTALNQLSASRSAKIDRVTAAVQGGSYQTSSTATGNAVVADALSGRN